ncbi:mCG1041818 [Mus musculus]|nr:mCG1041818 [Mus musculus]
MDAVLWCACEVPVYDFIAFQTIFQRACRPSWLCLCEVRFLSTVTNGWCCPANVVIPPEVQCYPERFDLDFPNSDCCGTAFYLLCCHLRIIFQEMSTLNLFPVQTVFP